MIEALFGILFFIVPLIFYPKSSEVFEFNKLITIYIFTALICGAWIIKMIVQKKIIFKRTVLDIPLILFLISQIISTIFSIDIQTSLFGYYGRWNGGLLSLISIVILYWAFVSNIYKNSVKKIITIALISGVMVAIYGILEHFGHSVSCIFINGQFNDDCWVQEVQKRVFATIGQPNWMAAYLISLAPLAWYCALRQKQKDRTILWLIASLLMFLALIFTKSRSGLLAFGIESVIFWGFVLLKDFKKNIPIFIVLILSLGGLFLVFNKDAVNQSPSSGEEGTESSDIRKIVWSGAIDIWKHYPIFGTGVETFAYSYFQFRPVAHNMTSEWNFLYNKAHNEYLNFAATTGSVGILTYGIVIISSLFQIFKSKSEFKFAILAGYISILITNFFGFSVSIISLLFFLLPAFVVAAETKNEKFQKINLSQNQKILIFITICVSSFTIFSIGKYWLGDYKYSLGKIYKDNLEYKASIQNLTTAIDINPSVAVYHAELADTYNAVSNVFIENKDATGAATLKKAAAYEMVTALNLSPRNINIRYTALNIFPIPDAIALMENTIPLAPTDPKIFYNLGRLYKKDRNKNKAKEEFQRALTLKPDYEDAKRELQDIK